MYFQKHNQAQLQARQQHPNSNVTNNIRKGLPLAVGGSTSNTSISKVGLSTLAAKQAVSIQAVQRQLVSAGTCHPTTSITTTSTSASSSSPVAIITNLSVGSACREVGVQWLCTHTCSLFCSFAVCCLPQGLSGAWV